MIDGPLLHGPSIISLVSPDWSDPGPDFVGPPRFGAPPSPGGLALLAADSSSARSRTRQARRKLEVVRGFRPDQWTATPPYTQAIASGAAATNHRLVEGGAYPQLD
jgi:hypothetical protein